MGMSRHSMFLSLYSVPSFDDVFCCSTQRSKWEVRYLQCIVFNRRTQYHSAILRIIITIFLERFSIVFCIPILLTTWRSSSTFRANFQPLEQWSILSTHHPLSRSLALDDREHSLYQEALVRHFLNWFKQGTLSEGKAICEREPIWDVSFFLEFHN